MAGHNDDRQHAAAADPSASDDAGRSHDCAKQGRRPGVPELAADDWQLIANCGYDWEYWVGPDGRLRWMSPSCERITGYPAARFFADPDLLLRMVHPEDRGILRRHLREQLGAEEPCRLQFRGHRADGEVRWLEHICQPVLAADGSFAGRRVSTRDVTESRATQEKLRQRERELETLTENSPDIVVRFDRNLRHRYVNAAVERATGLKAEQFFGKTNEELGMPSALCARWSSALHEVFRSGEPAHLDFSFPAPDGERYYSLRAVPERASDGGIETVLCTTRDETARRAAESRVQTLATVVETSRDFIGVADLDGRGLYLNAAGQALVGLGGDDAVENRPIEDYLFPEDIAFVRDTIMPAVMSEGRWHGEFRFRHFTTGQPIDVHWDIVRIDDPDTGLPTRIATVTRDIRKEKAAAAALIESGRRKDDFLAMLGHELRNPMAPIRSAIDLLHLLKADDDPRIAQAIAILDRQSAHLSRLLDDLLDVSRIIRGKLHLERGLIDLRDVIREVADSVASTMTARGHVFETLLPEAALMVDGDRVRLSQILLNLLINAADYTPHGGHVRLVAEATEGQVRVGIRDSGRGMAPEQIEHLFGAFSRGGAEGRPSGGSAEGHPAGGLGLGLTISRRLAEMHGGRLTARSNWPDPGSELTLCLPPSTPAGGGSAETPAPDAPTPSAGTSSVLIVDDNTDVAAALSLLLDALGYRPQVAATGTRALELARRIRPDLAFIDIGLPDIDGLEVARRLRATQPDKSRLLLVALTGYGHAEARQRSLAAGFDEHLAKPVDLSTLKALLARLN
ncbi:MAG: PAS domain-containing protein [Thiohalocapsa sp.]|nr:PAS domain-containing protein [Thiohalocapsa sp.]